MMFWMVLVVAATLSLQAVLLNMYLIKDSTYERSHSNTYQLYKTYHRSKKNNMEKINPVKFMFK